MSPTDQIIALAKFEGWKVEASGRDQIFSWTDPNRSFRGRFYYGEWPDVGNGVLKYLTDENAARNIERLLPIDRRFAYRTMLTKVITRDHKRGEYWASDPIFASAEQRMEAALRVLNLWKD